MEHSANTGLRNNGLKMSLTTLVLVVEAGSAGFYVTVTRSLAPIFMAFLGFSITGIMLVTSIAYLIALAVILLLRWHGVRRIRSMLLVSHGVERVAWGLLPLTAVLDWRMLVALYALAVSFAAITGLLIGVVVYNIPGENGPRRLIAFRNAAFTATSIIGSLTSIIVLAAMSSYFKYIYLYTLAAIIGLLATILLALVKLPVADEASAINSTVSESDVEVKSSVVFTFMVLFMASSAVLNVEWGPYIMHELRAPDYTAAMLGFTGMITSIIANLYWLRVDYSAYKRSLLILPLVPVAVVLVRSLPLHFGLNAIYAFAATGASLLASFLYADMSRKLGAFTSSLMTTIAFLSSQAVGLLTALAVFQAGTWATFLSATAYATLAVFTAFYSLPEVAVVPRDQALLHARRLHLVASSTFTVVVVASRRTIIVVLRTLAFTLALLILLFLYRLLYLLLIPM